MVVMSENSLRFAAIDPETNPSSDELERAADTVRSAFPRAVAVEVTGWDCVTFIDNGANLEAVRCPSCDADLLARDVWSDAMTRSYATGFEDRTFVVPCCGATHPLEGLVYEWPVAFGRFSIDVLEPDSPAFTPGRPKTPFESELLDSLRSALGTPVTAVWQHI
jgi:hypothetical protein